MYEYPARIQQLSNDEYMVRFDDAPEAITRGETEAIALEWAEDALLVALAGYMEDHRDIPAPSAPEPGQPIVQPDPMSCVKLTLYQAMRDRGMSQLALARLLHCDAKQVRRLLDLDHKSTLDQLIDAANVLGFRVHVDLEPLGQGANGARRVGGQAVAP